MLEREPASRWSMELGQDVPWVVSRVDSPGAPELHQFLSRNELAHRWLDPASDPLVALLGAEASLERPLPLIVCPDGSTVEPPPSYQDARPELDQAGVTNYSETADWRARVAAAFGLATTPAFEDYDVFIVGGGPAGLTAAVNASSEGLRTVLVERMAPGGQAGTSARIENYPGFPEGVTGAELAAATYEQARRFGTEILVGVEPAHVTVDVETGRAVVTLTSGARLATRTAVVAPGVAYRRLEADGIEDLLGRGAFYGSAPGEAAGCQGLPVAVVGGANSAGQAALHLSQYAARVSVIARESSLAKRMSAYLVERIENCDNIDVLLHSEVTRAEGSDRLEALAVSSPDGEMQLPVAALFVLIGGVPLTRGVSGWLRADPQGFLMTGRDLLAPDERSWWPLERDPYMLESSQPGIFIAGDVRHGSTKRVASAVGEGAMAVQLIHQYLANPDPIQAGTPQPPRVTLQAGHSSQDPRSSDRPHSG